MSQIPTLSIIIVSFDTKKEVINCLKSIHKSTKSPSFEIIVVDNQQDTSLKKHLTKHFPTTKLLTPKSNLGFGAANNLAAKQARGKLLFFLNPDTKLFPSTLKNLVFEYNKATKPGLFAPTLLDPGKTAYPLQGTSKLTPLRAAMSLSFINKLWPSNPISQKYWLKHKNRSKTYQVDVVPGSAFLVSTKLFQKVSGFDENFFLYFEESDLSLRVQQQGFTNYITPNSKLVHTWGQSTTKQPKAQIDKHFQKSKNYYFTKHFGRWDSLFVNSITSFSLKHLIFFIILLLAAIPRFYKLDTLMPFIGDFGRDFLAAREAVLTRSIPLLGIPSSVPRFHQGPLYVWLLIPTLFLSGYDPYAAGLLASLLGLFAVGAVFLVLDRLNKPKLAALASFILATSPLAIIHSRMPFHTNAIPLFSAIYLYSLTKLTTTNKSIFFAALSFALLFQLELVAAPLFLLIPLSSLISKTIPSRKTTLHILLGLTIGLLPLIVYDLTNSFKQLGTFIVWIGYRITSFAGFLPEHTTSGSKLSSVTNTILTYTTKFISWDLSIITLVLISTIIFALVSKRKTIPHVIQISTAWMLLSLSSYLVLGNASEAYFPILFVPLSLLIAWSVLELPKKLCQIITILLIILGIINIRTTISSDYFLSTNRNKHSQNSIYGPPISDQIQAANLINSFNTPVRLVNTEPGSHFPSHLDNYRFLLLTRGGELDKQGVPIWIFQKPTQTVPLNSQVYNFGQITIGVPLED